MSLRTNNDPKPQSNLVFGAKLFAIAGLILAIIWWIDRSVR